MMFESITMGNLIRSLSLKHQNISLIRKPKSSTLSMIQTLNYLGTTINMEKETNTFYIQKIYSSILENL